MATWYFGYEPSINIIIEW